jgi:hypothetical protein
MERIGIRGFYQLLAPTERRLPTVNEILRGATVREDIFDKNRNELRYFILANLVRIGLYLPVGYGLWQLGAQTAFGLWIVVNMIHLLSLLSEVYKRYLLRMVERRRQIFRQAERPSPPPEPVTRGYFSPKLPETIDNYRRIGMERWRKIVVRFVERLSTGPVNDLSTRRGLLEFQHVTIVSEKVHLVAGTISVLLVVPFFRYQDWPFAAYGAFLVLLDLYLVLLQRYHRVRIWNALRLEHGG